nr:hypothetical protein [uncultured Marinifilum sp.]
MTLELVFKSLDLQFHRMDQLTSRLQQLPISIHTLDDDESRTLIDAFIYRFSKIQDMMGQKLFPVFMDFIQEDARRMPFIDILNLLEKLDLIPDAETWLSFRTLRNNLSHEYPDNEEEIIEGIEKALEVYPQVKKVYESFKNEYEKRK